ncbi:hypothetical protein A9P82_02445 [Arachidicoccus ginsenosidimutans]|uniref:TlpA disulfide reductase family protein n=1 Tax=Arachidicoccus sp. BS20 TaxID=1850526 RepID=UPI0007F04E34|nr:TlpA disulfide reductase family protein [Arachidicoccus sp. BS20]ANI88261.1 hypothetical protein A9P82_02445 [Arachidicoccus sp. BS20]
MKHVFFLFFTAFVITANAQQKYFIDGTVYPVPKDLTVHMYYQIPGTGILKHDSSKVVEGKFDFKGDLPAVGLGFLVVLPDGKTLKHYIDEHMSLPKDQIGIYLENGHIKVNVNDKHPEDVVVSGTFNNDAVQEARPLMRKYKHAEADIKKRLAEAEKDSLKSQSIIGDYNQMVKERTVAVGEYVKTHPDALASIDLMKSWVLPTDDLTDAQKFYGYLSDSLKASPNALIYKRIMDAVAKVDINSLAPDFVLKDTAGTEHRLSDYRGKYVLVDFWASWCGPCLREMPNVVEAYKQFKSKNFQILGISLDGGSGNAKEKWENAIEHEGMTWPQLSDLMGWNSTVAKQYMVTSIPMNFLINPEGKIIAKNLRGDDLKNALKKYLGA